MGLVRFGLIGIGGYARQYVTALETLCGEGLATASLALVRNPDKYPEQMEQIRKMGCEIVPDIDAFYAAGDKMDIVGIPTGIPTHKPLTVQAHQQGFDVLVEKPPTAVLQDLYAMLDAGREAGKFCAVGFQIESYPSIRTLKKYILQGRFGKLKGVAVRGHWLRQDSYYERNPWAGKLKHEGEWVLEGPSINALSHQLNNMLYLAGPSQNEAAPVATVRAELYVAHSGPGEDSSCMEVTTIDGVKAHFYVTFCSRRNVNPVIYIDGTDGQAVWEMNGKTEMTFADGSTETIEEDENAGLYGIAEMFRNVVRRYKGEDDHLNCSLAMTEPFLKAINGAYYSNGGFARRLPEEFIEREEADDARNNGLKTFNTHVKDIDDIMDRAFAERKLYSDIGVPWAVATEPYDVTGLTSFDFPEP